MMTRSGDMNEDELLPGALIGITALICAGVLIAMAALGPLGTEDIQYRTSQSGLWQVMGQDIADMVLLAPLLIIGGILHLMRRPAAKYLLVLTPLTLMYTGLSLGIGQEWSTSPGNVESYFWIYLALMVGGLLILVGTLPLFKAVDVIPFDRRRLTAFVAITALAILLFAGMWVGQINEVVATGDLSDGSYSDSPNVFWTVRFLDLGVSVPLGFIALFLMLRRPEKGYPLMLLFFGFFLTMSITVNAMAAVQVLNDDPAMESMGAGILIFPIMAVLFLAGLVYLLRHRHAGVASEGTE